MKQTVRIDGILDQDSNRHDSFLDVVLVVKTTGFADCSPVEYKREKSMIFSRFCLEGNWSSRSLSLSIPLVRLVLEGKEVESDIWF